MNKSTQYQYSWEAEGSFPVWDGKRWWTRRELIEDVLAGAPESTF